MKPIIMVLVAAFALLTLVSTLFMPGAELLPAQVNPSPPQHGELPRPTAIMDIFYDIGDAALKLTGHQGSIKDVITNNPNTPFYVYSVFLGIALVSSAIAINAIGRFDSEEKTVLPVKK